MFKLINQQGQVINEGDRVKCFRGEDHTVKGFTPPLHWTSTGRVCVETSDGFARDYFPQVFDLKIIKEEIK